MADSNSRQYLRKTNLRWIGLLIVLMGVIAFIMIDADRILLKYGLSAIFIVWGVSWLRQKSLHTLWIEDNDLHWQSTEGKKINSDHVSIRDIQRIELLKKGKAGKNSMQWVEVQIFTGDNQYTLPRNINFGGTGNPRFDDIVEKLRPYNAGFAYEVKDQIDRSGLLGYKDED